MTLLDYYLPVFSHTLLALKDPEETAESLRQTLMQLYDTAYHQASQRHYSRQDIYAASSAILICLDELILCSGHPLAGCWRSSPLQSEIHGKRLGGMLFFQQLEEISDDNDELRILYLFCLFTGYKGRYVSDDNNVLENIITLHIKKLPREYVRCLKNDETQSWNIHPPMIEKKKKKPLLSISILLVTTVFYVSMNLMLII